jgi:hypothetical protein
MKILLCILCILSCVAFAPSAKGTILTFDVVPIPSILYDQYGDSANADSMYWGYQRMGNGWTPDIFIDYRTALLSNDSTTCACLATWGGGYGDLGNIAYPVTSSGAYGEVSLVPLPGVQVRVNAFDLASYSGDQPLQPVLVVDASGNVLWDAGSPTIHKCVPGSDPCIATHEHFTPNVQSGGILRIRFGNNWNIAIDNVDFDQIGMSAVRPTSWGAIKALFR